MTRIIAVLMFAAIVTTTSAEAASFGPWDIVFTTGIELSPATSGTPIEIDAFLRPDSYDPLIFDDVNWGFAVTTSSPNLEIQYPDAADVHDKPRFGVINGVPLAPSLNGMTLVIPAGEVWPSGGILFPVAYLTLNSAGPEFYRFQFHIEDNYVTFDGHIFEGRIDQSHSGTTEYGAPLPIDVPEPSALALVAIGAVTFLHRFAPKPFEGTSANTRL